MSAINFAGNNHVPAEKLFEFAVGPTRERYSRLQKELPFVATDVQEGADLVHRYYISEGYLEAVVDSPQYHFSANGTRVDATIPVHEGRQYFFGNLIFHGNTIYDPETLRGQMLDLLSQPYTDHRVDDISRRLQAYFKARGYYAVKVDATGEPEQAVGGHVPVIVTLSPGPVYKFDGVNVTGLRRLRPSYVRNRFASLEGKNYSPDVLDEKFRELMRTGLFNVLQINPQPEAGNYLRLDISAEEAKAKEFGFSVGYGTYVGGIVGLSFADRDLFGYGRPLTTSIEISERGYKGEILWDDPHFFESDVELKIRLSAFTFDFDGYSKFEIGARTEFSYNITKQYQVGVFGSERRVEIVSNEIKDKFIGDTKYFVSSIGLFHTLDLRDSPVVPSRGLILGQTFELAANAIGSEIELFRTTARASYFIPIGKLCWKSAPAPGWSGRWRKAPATSTRFRSTSVSLMVAALLCAASANAISGRMITGATRSAGNFIPSSMSNIPSRFMANCRARFFSMPVICCPMPTIPVSVTCAMESVRVYATNYPSARSGSIMA